MVCCHLLSSTAIAQPVCGNLQLSEGFLHVVSAVIATVDVQAALGKTSKIVPVCEKILLKTVYKPHTSYMQCCGESVIHSLHESDLSRVQSLHDQT